MVTRNKREKLETGLNKGEQVRDEGQRLPAMGKGREGKGREGKVG